MHINSSQARLNLRCSHHQCWINNSLLTLSNPTQEVQILRVKCTTWAWTQWISQLLRLLEWLRKCKTQCTAYPCILAIKTTTPGREKCSNKIVLLNRLKKKSKQSRVNQTGAHERFNDHAKILFRNMLNSVRIIITSCQMMLKEVLS